MAAAVAFTGLLAEFLILALAGMPYRPGQARGEFLFWSIVSLLILALMIIQLVIIYIWRRRLPTMTRTPDSIASVMSYVAGTGMSRDFENLSQVSTRERNRTIKNMGKNYVYGWRREDDSGRVRWVVDEVGTEQAPPPVASAKRPTRVESF
jgi:glucan phosphoethanolaminetransferase (alkaline phosphatase superfamily)